MGWCWACGNVRYIDVSNEERWAPLIRRGWEWAVKSYQASQRPTFSTAQLKWARFCWGTRRAAKPLEANEKEKRRLDPHRGLKGLFAQWRHIRQIKIQVQDVSNIGRLFTHNAPRSVNSSISFLLKLLIIICQSELCQKLVWKTADQTILESKVFSLQRTA